MNRTHWTNEQETLNAMLVDFARNYKGDAETFVDKAHEVVEAVKGSLGWSMKESQAEEVAILTAERFSIPSKFERA